MLFMVTSATRKCYVTANSKEDALAIAESRGAKGPLKARKCPVNAKTPMVFNDGGQKRSGIRDKSNCTVRAISIALDIDYKSADRLLEVYGRDRFKGFWLNRLLGTKCFANVFQKVDEFSVQYNWKDYHAGKIKRARQYRTLGQFLNESPKGRFIIHIEGHAFAVVDGVVHDTFSTGMKTTIRSVWRVII